jgi:hypothetical protein
MTTTIPPEAKGEINMANTVVQVTTIRPTDCVRPKSCSGSVIYTTEDHAIPSCGLSGCKHNHNPTHGGCGTDLRSTWSHTSHEQ